MEKKRYVLPVAEEMALYAEGVVAASGKRVELHEDHLKEEFANKKNPIW